MAHLRVGFWIGLFVLLLVSLAGLNSLSIPQAQAAPLGPVDLLISEYVEGSGYNKAVEIFNPTATAIDLSAYTLSLYMNGNATPTYNLQLSGVLSSGHTLVIAHTSADPALQARATITWGQLSFNGNDAVVLYHGAQVVDSIGRVGEDPGARWGTTQLGTQDLTLRRKSTVCRGDTVADDPFDPSLEWDAYPQDTFDGLGSHAIQCGPTAVALVAAAARAMAWGVLVTWISASELDVQGYHVYRQAAGEAEWTRLTPVLVASPSPGAPVGHEYRWEDRTARPGVVYRYRIDAVTPAGEHETWRILEVQRPFPSLWLPLVRR